MHERQPAPRPRPRNHAVALALVLLVPIVVAALAIPAPAGAQNGSGVGVAPATLRFDDPPLVRGGTKVGTLSFQQQDYERADVQVSVQPSTDRTDASAWVTIDPAGTFSVPRTSDFPVNVTVTVPNDAANGVYGAKVNLRTVQVCDSDGACSALQTGASSTLVIQVGGAEVKRIEVGSSSQVLDLEQGGRWQVKVPLANTGNVDARPSIRIDIQDQQRSRVLTTVWWNDTTLKPGEEGHYAFLFDDLGLDLGQYWALVTVFLDGQEVKRLGAQTFDVVEAGALARKAELLTITLEPARAFFDTGELVKVIAVVENTGDAPLVATFKGEVAKDGKLFDTLESDPLEIATGDQGRLEMVYTIREAGQYNIQGKVHYGSKVTADKSVLFQASGSAPIPWMWIGLAALGLVIVVLAFVLGRRAGGNKGDAPSGSRRGRGGGAPPGRSRSPGRHPGRHPARAPPPQQRPPGRAPPRRPPQGRPPSGRPPQGRAPQGRPPQGRPPQGRPGTSGQARSR